MTKPSLTATVGRNLASYFLARGVEAVLLLVTVPLLVRTLGPERYGVFSLGLIAFFYLAILELGMSQGLVTLLSECRVRDDARGVEGLLGSALVLYAGAALAGGLAVMGLAPLAAERLLSVPPELVPDAARVLRIVGVSFVLYLAEAPLRSALTAFHRAALVNAGLLAAALIRYPAMILALRTDGGVVPVFAAYASGTLVELGVVAVAAARLLKARGLRPRWDAGRVRGLLRFGAATSASTLAGLFIIHLDKMAIGLVLPVAALGAYHVAYAIASRLAEIPRGLVGAAPAALSELAGSGQAERLGRAYLRTLKLLFAAPLHLAALLLLSGHALLHAWVGPELARTSAGALAWLTGAYFLSGLAHGPHLLASAAGFPQIPAKTRLLLLLPAAALSFVLTRRHGLEGAALACLVVQAVDLVVMAAWVHRRGGVSLSLAPFWKPLALSAALCLPTWAALGRVSGLAALLAVLGASYALYLAGCFAWVLEPAERAVLLRREA